MEAKSEGCAGCCAPHPKEEPTLSTTYMYIHHRRHLPTLSPFALPGAMAAGIVSRYKTGLRLETYRYKTGPRLDTYR